MYSFRIGQLVQIGEIGFIWLKIQAWSPAGQQSVLPCYARSADRDKRVWHYWGCWKGLDLASSCVGFVYQGVPVDIWTEVKLLRISCSALPVPYLRLFLVSLWHPPARILLYYYITRRP